jgi:hypothetical protein
VRHCGPPIAARVCDKHHCCSRGLRTGPQRCRGPLVISPSWADCEVVAGASWVEGACTHARHEFLVGNSHVGLRSVLLRTADHSFSALTDGVINPVEATHIMRCVTEFPRPGAALMWAATRGEARGRRASRQYWPAQRRRGLALPIKEDRNAWLKDWGKHLRESLAVSDCGPVDIEIPRLLDELEKPLQTHLLRSSAPSTSISSLPTL